MGLSLLRSVTFYNLRNAVNGHFRVNRTVNGNGGGDTARAYTTKSVKSKQAVVGRFARFDMKQIRKLIYNLLRAFDVASRSQTTTDNVLALRFKREKRVESYDAVNFRNRNTRPFGNEFLYFERNVTVLFLHVA